MESARAVRPEDPVLCCWWARSSRTLERWRPLVASPLVAKRVRLVAQSSHDLIWAQAKEHPPSARAAGFERHTQVSLSVIAEPAGIRKGDSYHAAAGTISC